MIFPLTTLIAALASKQLVQLNKKKEGKSCIEGAKYAAKKYLPPPSKMCGVNSIKLLLQLHKI